MRRFKNCGLVKIALKLSYFYKKMQSFQTLGLRHQTPVPQAAGALAAYPKNSSPYCEFLAARLNTVS